MNMLPAANVKNRNFISVYKGEVNPTTHSIFSQNFIKKKNHKQQTIKSDSQFKGKKNAIVYCILSPYLLFNTRGMDKIQKTL